MEKALLKTKIIDTEKYESLNKIKTKVGTLHAIIIAILIALLNSSNSDSLLEKLNIPIIIVVILIAIIAIGSVLLVAFVYVRVPSKGALHFYEDYLTFVLNKKRSTIKIDELDKMNFYIEKSKYLIGITKNRKESVFEIDIVFQNEKRKINELVKIWTEKDIKISILDKNELSKTARLKKKPKTKSSSKDLKYDFSKYKLKLKAGIPFKAKTKIAYNKISKKALFVLAIESIENLNWAVINYNTNGISGVTDRVIKLFGNSFFIQFKKEFMIITFQDNGGSMFPLGAKKHIRSFLTSMSELSNALDLKFIEESYDNMFN